MRTLKLQVFVNCCAEWLVIGVRYFREIQVDVTYAELLQTRIQNFLDSMMIFSMIEL